jgi:prolyl-tRNA editing enzyme YbaK/EbsC (Cys-tRNA(Pro) deacylase)
MSAYEKIISKLKNHGISYKLYSHEILLLSSDAYEHHDLEFNAENGFKTLVFQICGRLVLVALHGRDKIDYNKICEFFWHKKKRH